MTGHMLNIEIVDGILRIEVAGSLDAETAFHLDQQINARYPDATEGIVLNLNHTEFMDSAGVGFVVRLRERAKRASNSFEIIRVGGQPRRLLEQIGGISILELKGNEGDIANA
ncbi:STAS domain-containing protein [Nisaea nitritireducens]|uniref:STAS domain-containing protein n=1 Tax=Nisaea nitritireducens TaxID=568392 RepID=UPI0018686718|nr:STAS domain-containing protein [Nisaea nitritireducens]